MWWLLVAPLFQPILLCLWKLFRALIFQEIELLDKHTRVAVERSYLARGYISSVRLPFPNAPWVLGDGIHVLRFCKTMFLLKISSTYVGREGRPTRTFYAYVFRPHALLWRAFLLSLAPQPDRVACAYVTTTAPWRTLSSSSTYACPWKPLRWQKQVLQETMKHWGSSGRVSVLLSGAMGIGKSRLADFISLELRKRHGVAGTVIKGFNACIKGQALEDCLETLPTREETCILLLDEFDDWVRMAERLDQNLCPLDNAAVHESREGNAFADTPSSLLALLDRLQTIENCFIIATTNLDLSHFTKDPRTGRYIRKGRFDLFVQASKVIDSSNKPRVEFSITHDLPTNNQTSRVLQI